MKSSTDNLETASIRRRLIIAGLLMLTIYTGGTLGYFLLGAGRWRLAECAYMAVISLTTVGYGEILPGMDRVPYARAFTAGLLVSGAGIAFYAVSVLTTFLVEGEFLHLRRRRRMRKGIDKLNEHIIVCGLGRTGTHVVDELLASHRPFVVVENSAEAIERWDEQRPSTPLLTLAGDATDDRVLLDAGIKRATGVLATLGDDRDNLYVVVSARALNDKLRIVAKAADARAVCKLEAAGANAVVSVNLIGGLRMASEMIRPHVVTFLDGMLRDRDRNLRFEELTIPAGSALCGKALAETDIRRERNLLIVAARGPAEGDYTYSPGPSFVLQPGMTLILIGETASVQRLRESGQFSGEG